MKTTDVASPLVPERVSVSERVMTLLRATSRTFSLSIEGLPAGLREEIAVSYLLLRVSDYFEDHHDLTPSEKVRLLDLWQEAVDDPGLSPVVLRAIRAIPHRPDDPEATVVHEADLLLERLASFPADTKRVIRRRVGETTRGMARWQVKGPRVENEAELDDYMHHVAGLVGYLVTDLFALRFSRIAERRHVMMPLAREFGLALQCVNILRGLRKDYERGWIFVPRSLCASYGLAAADLFRGTSQVPAMKVVHDLAAKAERHLYNGLRYILLIPRSLHRLRLACMWPLLFAAGTLAVTRDNPDVLRGEAKITRETVKRIVRNTTLFGWSNVWVTAYTKRLLGSGG